MREYGKIANTAVSLKQLTAKLERGGRELRFCYEAGPYGYGVQRLLNAVGHDCVVVVPSLIPRTPGERIKTDRRDPINLAKLHRAGDLARCLVPECDGAKSVLTRQAEEALWQAFFTAAPVRRREFRAGRQAAQTSSRTLATQYRVNSKTILKRRKRTSTADAATGPKNPKSTVLTLAEEAIVVEFPRRTLLPLDDTLGCLRDVIPILSRSALHRCLQRDGISRLPKDDTKDSRKR